MSPDCLVLTADRAKGLIDENTIGVVAILGSTFNGEFEDVESIHSMVVAVNKENGWNVPIHVDAASGGFIAPFLQPDLLWDFRLEQVKSINVSGHKFGLVYAGMLDLAQASDGACGGNHKTCQRSSFFMLTIWAAIKHRLP